MQRLDFKNALLFSIALALSLVLAGCEGDDNNPSPVVANDLQGQQFTFDDGSAFGFANAPVTMDYGAFNGNTRTFVLIAPSARAEGDVTIGSCNHVVQATNNPGLLPVGTEILCPTCNIQPDGSLSVVCGSTDAASLSAPGITGSTGTGGADTTGTTGG